MAQDKYILALDEGTTCAKAIVYDHEGAAKGRGAHEITKIFPTSGWVEHDPDEIWRAQVLAIKDEMREARIQPSQLEAAGITNQRETTILWNKRTGSAREKQRTSHETLIFVPHVGAGAKAFLSQRDYRLPILLVSSIM